QRKRQRAAHGRPSALPRELRQQRRADLQLQSRRHARVVRSLQADREEPERHRDHPARPARHRQASGIPSGGEVIETARNEDLQAIIQLLRTQLEEHDIVLTSAALERATRGLIEDHSLGRILTFKLDGELVGVAVISFLWTLEHGGPAAWLDEVYVEPTRRGHGLGQQLIEAAMQVARDSGCIALDLEVDAGHEAAERLYQRMDFKRHRRVRWVRMLDR